MNTHYDAIVIGGGLAGSIAVRILSEQRYRVLVIEKQEHLGQNNRSFQNGRGEIFDPGYHALDENRSPFTTRFFAKVLDGKMHRIRLRRGIVVSGHLFDFNAPVSEWPQKLAALFPAKELDDSIGGEPSRQSLARIYGSAFTMLAFDEIVSSYPSLQWQRERGVPEEKLLNLIYPWFFPRARRHWLPTDESGRFHAAMRESGDQQVLYPDEGGFGSFVEGIVRGIDHNFTTVRTGAKDVQCRFDASSLLMQGVQCDGVDYTADQYFWCAPVTGLAKLAGLSVPALHPQRLALGSFSFDREVTCPYHEILVGDPRVPIGRISFPGKIAGTSNHRVQAEYLYPVGFHEADPATWQAQCLESFRALGIISRDAQVVEYTQTFEPRGFASVEDLYASVHHYGEVFATERTNVRIPHLGLGPENINRVVPSVFKTVYTAITQ